MARPTATLERPVLLRLRFTCDACGGTLLRRRGGRGAWCPRCTARTVGALAAADEGADPTAGSTGVDHTATG